MADFINIRRVEAISNLRSRISSAVSDINGYTSRLYSALSDVQMQAEEALAEALDKLEEVQRRLDDEQRELSVIADRLDAAERHRNSDNPSSEAEYDYWRSRYNAQLAIVQELERKVQQIEKIVRQITACKSSLDSKGNQIRAFALKYRIDMEDTSDNAGTMLSDFAQDVNSSRRNFRKNIL